MIRHYYFRSTFDAYDFSKINIKFDRSVIIIAQHYENKIIRDFDNRNRKLIQDAIRHTGLIGDGSWWRVWNVDIGFLDPRGNHVQVYVVSQENFVEFITSCSVTIFTWHIYRKQEELMDHLSGATSQDFLG